MRVMTLPRARLRYLTAIGAMLPSAALGACKEPTPPANGDATSAATTVATETATPRALHMPTCPSGGYCVPESESANADGGAAAPAPYQRCAERAARPGERPGVTPGIVHFSAPDTAAQRTKDPTACCYTWVIPCPGGRAFRDASGAPSVARPTARTEWTRADFGAIATAALSPEDRALHAAHWTREAAFEHASIASFAQLTLDLLAVGAPPELLEATQRATLDEIEHARIAFSLATAYGGHPVGPAALTAAPATSRTLAALAKSTFVDACVGESVASASLAESARQATDPALRDALSRMAADEERHAELAWRIVAWTLRDGDEEVRSVLADAMDEVVAELVSLSRSGAPQSPARSLRATVLREIVLPCTVALLTSKEPTTFESPTLSA
jgi:hypothetical protein